MTINDNINPWRFQARRLRGKTNREGPKSLHLFKIRWILWWWQLFGITQMVTFTKLTKWLIFLPNYAIFLGITSFKAPYIILWINNEGAFEAGNKNSSPHFSYAAQSPRTLLVSSPQQTCIYSVIKTQPEAGVSMWHYRERFVRPAMLSGNFQIINIYVI